jgi:hypothetical protein
MERMTDLNIPKRLSQPLDGHQLPDDASRPRSSGFANLGAMPVQNFTERIFVFESIGALSSSSH